MVQTSSVASIITAVQCTFCICTVHVLCPCTLSALMSAGIWGCMYNSEFITNEIGSSKAGKTPYFWANYACKHVSITCEKFRLCFVSPLAFAMLLAMQFRANTLSNASVFHIIFLLLIQKLHVLTLIQ